MKVNDLTPPELDYWVAKAEGKDPRCGGCGWVYAEERSKGCRPGDCSQRPMPHPSQQNKMTVDQDPSANHLVYWSPSTDWSQGGPIIERNKIRVQPISDEDAWQAFVMAGGSRVKGHTPLIAAMRAWVASKFRDTVEG